MEATTNAIWSDCASRIQIIGKIFNASSPKFNELSLSPSTLYPPPPQKKMFTSLYWGKSSSLRIQLIGKKQFPQNPLLLCHLEIQRKISVIEKHIEGMQFFAGRPYVFVFTQKGHETLSKAGSHGATFAECKGLEGTL